MNRIIVLMFFVQLTAFKLQLRSFETKFAILFHQHKQLLTDANIESIDNIENAIDDAQRLGWFCGEVPC